MKLTKRISSLLLALLMVITVFAMPAPVSAAEKSSVPSKVRIYPLSYDDNAIEFNYANPGDQIKNLKSSSKNLVVKQTYHREESEEYSATTGTANNSYARIGAYAKKEGKYTVSFDIYSKDGSVKRSSHKVTVFAKSDSPLSSIKLDGKSLWDDDAYNAFTTKKSGKLSIKMAKGYTLKTITIRTYNKEGDYVEKTVKNNQKITLGKYGSSYSYNYQSTYNPSFWNSYWSNSISAPTYIQITYKDKWTKQIDTVTYSVRRLAL